MKRNEIVLDLETTGLSPEMNQIIEIAAIRRQDGASFSTLVNPGIEIPERIIEITGIDNQMVKEGVTIGEALEQLDCFLGKAPVLIGHNIGFDYSFLKVHFSREKKTGRSFPNWGDGNCEGIDTLKICKQLHKTGPHNLGAMTLLYGIHNRSAHRALADTEATALLYEKLLNEAEELCAPFPLVYREKKSSPITPKQKNFLLALLRQHGIALEQLDCPGDMEELTKSEASRVIDKIISTYGR